MLLQSVAALIPVLLLQEAIRVAPKIIEVCGVALKSYEVCEVREILGKIAR